SDEANRGGGIYNYQGFLRVQRSDISSNEARYGIGGGIAVISGTAIVDYSTISDNTAGGGAGGIYIESGTVTIQRTTISGNTFVGIDNLGGTVALTNSTVFFNYGGGIEVEGLYGNTPTMQISNSTIAYNGGGLTSGSGGSTVVKGSIFQGNSGEDCGSFEIITSLGYNLSSDVSCKPYFTQTGDAYQANIGLDPNGLQNNGGPTDTIALVVLSRAVEAMPVGACTDGDVNPITPDKRAVTRPQG